MLPIHRYEMHRITRPTYRALALTALFALALALRLYRIHAQSFWYDEGLTVALAIRPLDDIARAAAADPRLPAGRAAPTAGPRDAGPDPRAPPDPPAVPAAPAR
ncbi:MAG: hypothetical protein RMJ55_08585, partial [Roseiflexaceae bacterium]|nr:hypothetical protein [Roseiflexaceae bacterium]